MHARTDRTCYDGFWVMKPISTYLNWNVGVLQTVHDTTSNISSHLYSLFSYSCNRCCVKNNFRALPWVNLTTWTGSLDRSQHHSQACSFSTTSSGHHYGVCAALTASSAASPWLKPPIITTSSPSLGSPFQYYLQRRNGSANVAFSKDMSSGSFQTWVVSATIYSPNPPIPDTSLFCNCWPVYFNTKILFPRRQ